MSEDELRAKVDAIIAMAGDAEAAHSEEDMLHRAVIKAFAPEWVRKHIDRLTDAEFPRWCA